MSCSTTYNSQVELLHGCSQPQTQLPTGRRSEASKFGASMKPFLDQIVESGLTRQYTPYGIQSTADLLCSPVLADFAVKIFYSCISAHNLDCLIRLPALTRPLAGLY